MIDENSSHRRRGSGEEVIASLPLTIVTCEPDVGLVNNRRGLERVIRALATHATIRDLSQLVVENGK